MNAKQRTALKRAVARRRGESYPTKPVVIDCYWINGTVLRMVRRDA